MKEAAYISIIMPAYNAQKTLSASIESVLSQTYPYYELIIIDDASKDDTVSIAEAYASTDARVRVLKNAENSGVAVSRNRGIEEARYPWIALLDSDDLWYPEKLEKQMALAQAEGADILYCSYAMIDETGASAYSDFVVTPRTDLKQMLVKNWIGCSTVLIRKESLGELRFTKDFYHEDYALWLQLLQKGLTAAGNTEVLAAYRVSQGSRAYNKRHAARQRWRIYRRLLGFSTLKSARYFLVYAINGWIKYRKSR